MLRLNTIVKDGFQEIQSAYRVLLVLLSAMIYTKQTANSKEQERELEQWLPSISSLPKPAEFVEAIQILETFERQDRAFGANYWRPEADEISDEIVAALKDILNALEKAEQAIELECNWKLEVIGWGSKKRSGTPVHGVNL